MIVKQKFYDRLFLT